MTDVKRYETWETGSKQAVTVAADHPLSLIIEALQAENERLKAILEDGLSVSSDEVVAADSYWEIAGILNVPYGASVIDHARYLVSDECINKLKADAVRDVVASLGEFADKLEAVE